MAPQNIISVKINLTDAFEKEFTCELLKAYVTLNSDKPSFSFLSSLVRRSEKGLEKGQFLTLKKVLRNTLRTSLRTS